MIWRTLELRARRPEAFSGDYAPLDLGADVCAFVRGGAVLVVVPVRDRPIPEPEPEWRDVLRADLGVRLLER